MRAICVLVICFVCMAVANQAMADCKSGYALNGNDECVYCNSKSTVIHNGRCYTCADSYYLSSCRWDEEQQAAVHDRCTTGSALNAAGECVYCNSKSTVIHNGRCYTCEKAGYYSSTCRWDEEQQKAVIGSCTTGSALNEAGECVWCGYERFLIHEGKCYTCSSNYLSSCRWDEEQQKAVVGSCNKGAVLDKENDTCVWCGYSYHLIHEGKCYSCAVGTKELIESCRWDEEQQKAVIASCKSGYAVSNSGICVPCNSDTKVIRNGNCYNCSDAISGCNTCTYDQNSGKAECTACSQGTLINGECVNEQEVTCEAGKYLTPLKTCVTTCPSNYFANEVSKTCEPKADEPENCLEGYALQDGVCTYCSSRNQFIKDGQCYSCTDSNFLLSCHWDEESGGPVPVCLDGSGLQNGVCTNCSSRNQFIKDGQCYSCTDSNFLHSCQWDEESGGPVPVCLDGSVNKDGVCTNCSSRNQFIKDGQCYSCTDSNSLSSCQWNDESDAPSPVCLEGSVLQNETCVLCRGDNKFISNGVCYDCSGFVAGCSRCVYNEDKGRAECAGCNTGTLSDGECVVTPTRTCAAGTYLTALNTCVAECPSNYFANKETGACEKKPDGCTLFDDDGNCIGRCWENYLRRGDECVDKNEGCGVGFDIDEQKGECVLKIRYTIPEADALTTNDNNNWVEWIFE